MTLFGKQSLPYTLLGTSLVLLFCYFFVDQPLTYWIASLPLSVQKIAKIATASFAPNVLMTAGPLFYFFYVVLLKKTSLKREILFIIIAIPAAVVMVDVAKTLIGRTRPGLLLRADIYGFFPLGLKDSYRSFPSGHSAAICALMASLASYRPRAVVPLFLLGLSFSFLRVLGLAHFFSDVLGTAIMVFCLVFTLHSLYQREYHGRISERRSRQNTKN